MNKGENISICFFFLSASVSVFSLFTSFFQKFVHMYSPHCCCLSRINWKQLWALSRKGWTEMMEEKPTDGRTQFCLSVSFPNCNSISLVVVVVVVVVVVLFLSLFLLLFFFSWQKKRKKIKKKKIMLLLFGELFKYEKH